MSQLDDYIGLLRTWLDLPDPSHILLVLAAGATRAAGGEPLWLLMVAPPSSGKTEAVALLNDVTDAHLDDITPAGLLGWTRGRESRPTGVLTRVGDVALMTIGDLSTLLASSDRGSRDQVFALLRRAYDGEVTRDVSPPGKAAPGARLHWSGRLTVIGAVTGAIDRYAAHADELGARWVYYRLPPRDTASRRRAARAARGGNIEEHRRAARANAAVLVQAAAEQIGRINVSDHAADRIEDAALVTCWGRAAVPRHGYGRREIDGLPTIEDPPRVIRQLHMLTRGLLALGVTEDAAVQLVRKVALDSMPAARYAVLSALTAERDGLTTSALARAAGLHWNVAYRSAEDLQQTGILAAIHGPADAPRRLSTMDEDDDGKITGWRLAGDDGNDVASVIAQVSPPIQFTRYVESIEMGEMNKRKRGGTKPTDRVNRVSRPLPASGDPSIEHLLTLEPPEEDY